MTGACPGQCDPGAGSPRSYSCTLQEHCEFRAWARSLDLLRTRGYPRSQARSRSPSRELQLQDGNGGRESAKPRDNALRRAKLGEYDGACEDGDEDLRMGDEVRRQE